MRPVRVLLLEDHAILRTILSERLNREPDIEVVGDTDNANQAVELAKSLRPDVILSDIELPAGGCFDAARRINRFLPQVSFIILSAFAYDHHIEEALSVGAMGFLTKGEPPERIIEAIIAVADNRTRFSESVRNRIVIDDKGNRKLKGKTRSSLLTDREREILRSIAQGQAKKEIARLMHISVNTVDKHTSNLMGKLDIHDRVELTRFAIRERFVSP